MATNETNTNYFSGQGVLMVASRDPTTGNPMGFVPVGNCSALKINVATSVIEHKESQSGQRSIDLRLTTETKATMSMTLENFSKENLLIALRGEAATVVADTAYVMTSKAYLGKVIGLDHVAVSNVTVERPGPVALTVNVDYTVNPDGGSITLAAAIGSVVDGTTVLTITYDYAAQETVDALTVGATDRWLRFEGLNTADNNSAVVVEIFKVSTDPLKELSLIGDTIGQVVLDGNVLSDTLRTSGSKFFRQTAVA